MKAILFQPDMVCAILAERKTQTRRIAKFIERDGDGWHVHSRGGGMWGSDDDDVINYGPDYAPYSIGDRLFVKETWRTFADYDRIPPRDLPDDAPIFYPADGDVVGDWEILGRDYCVGRVRQSIFMQARFARLTLLTTDVRVERLQDISEADAVAEGLVAVNDGYALSPKGELWGQTARHCYAALWDSINGDRKGASWDDNPWVVALTFNVENRKIGL